MRKPLFLSDIDRMGELFWIEVQGYDAMIQRHSGNFAGVEKRILGWDAQTLSDILRMERETNYAPRVRYWRGKEKPTAEERRAGRWEDGSRLWMPSLRDMDDDERREEFLKTGRTVWPLPPDPDDPVKLNAELSAKGEEPLASMCAGCHFGKWKNGYDRRWLKTKNGNCVFLPCTNIGVDGWKHWNEYQEAPEACDGYCKIGEYKPKGIFAELAGVMQEIAKMPAGGHEDGL